MSAQELMLAPKLEAAVTLPTDLDTTANGVLSMCQAVAIIDTDSYKIAVTMYAEVKQRIENMDAQRKTLGGPFRDIVERINSIFRAPIKSYEAGLTVLKERMLAYDAQQKAKAEAAQRRAAKEKREAEEEVRQKQLAEERARREAAEAQARQERANREAAEAEARRAAQEREAAEAAARGDREAAAKAEADAAASRQQTLDAQKVAQQEREKAIEARRLQLKAERDLDAQRLAAAAPTEVVPAADKVDGVARKVVWKWRMKDPTLLNRKWMCPDTDLIDEFVSKNKGMAEGFFDGAIEVYSEAALAVGRGKR